MIYIRQKQVSVAKPEMKRQMANSVRFEVKDVAKSPTAPDKLDKIIAGNRPILSAKQPKKIVPNTEPTQNSD